MHRVLALSAAILALSGGVALADGGGTRDHRGSSFRGGHGSRGFSGSVSGGHVRQYAGRGLSHQSVVTRAPVRARRDGRFYFDGGFTRPYYRPSLSYRHRDYNRRPALIVENYDPVPGYSWVAGSWQWSGVEWIWTPGYYTGGPGYNDGYVAPPYEGSPEYPESSNGPYGAYQSGPGYPEPNYDPQGSYQSAPVNPPSSYPSSEYPATPPSNW